MHLGFYHPPLRMAPLGRAQGEEFLNLEQAVLDHHVANSFRRRGAPAKEIPSTQLAHVSGKYQLLAAVAPRCIALLGKVKRDLQEAKRSGAVAVDTTIGLTSAYRGPEYDEGLWRSYFRAKYYSANLGDFQYHAHSGLASIRRLETPVIETLIRYIAPVKAAPGYSNHTRGIAVDFTTTQSGKTYVPETGKKKGQRDLVNKAWETTWLYQWLDKHAKDYGAARIPTEAWHWEFK